MDFLISEFKCFFEKNRMKVEAAMNKKPVARGPEAPSFKPNICKKSKLLDKVDPNVPRYE